MAARTYIQRLEQSRATILAIDPAATVIMGGLTRNFPNQFLDAFEKAGGSQYTDALTVHPYGSVNCPAHKRPGAKVIDAMGATVASAVAGYQKIAAKDPNLANKPIWITEFGWRDMPGWATSYGKRRTNLHLLPSL